MDIKDLTVGDLPTLLEAIDGASLRELGDLHVMLICALDDVRELLGPAMRAAREDGATYHELAAASGYTSLTTIQQIVRPEARAAARKRERAARAR